MKTKFACSSSKQLTILAALACALTVLIRQDSSAQVGLRTYTGTFVDGATYLMEVPANYNGTLFLFSHGTAPPGVPNPPTDTGDSLTRLYLLSHGYALAGSSFAVTGWAVESAFKDQIATLDLFTKTVGVPKRTIAWGASMGGLITAGLIEKYPNRFSGAVPFCGLLGGAVGLWNEFLDAAFVFQTLLAPDSGLQIANIKYPIKNIQLSEQLLSAAQATPQGQARIALVAAMFDTPGSSIPPPNPKDYTAIELNQFFTLQGFPFQLFFGIRSNLEDRAGGNPSWNTGVDYKKQLEISVDYDEVRALYKTAGLSLDADLQSLSNTPRITANPEAVQYLSENVIFSGDLKVPVLTVHNTGDDIATVELEQAYAAVVHAAKNDSLLRQTYVNRAYHCNFTSAETIAALQSLLRRLDSGEWDGADPKDLNDAASALPHAYDGFVAPAFVDYKPAPFQRPFNIGGSGPRDH